LRHVHSLPACACFYAIIQCLIQSRHALLQMAAFCAAEAHILQVLLKLRLSKPVIFATAGRSLFRHFLQRCVTLRFRPAGTMDRRQKTRQSAHAVSD
ncbi:MAG: hypothetical protein ACTHLK_18535, partial [Brucella intermedia]